MRLLTLLFTAAVLYSGTGAAAQAPARKCQDDAGVDRCAPEQHRRLLDLYGLRAIEAHRADGDVVRRVFYVDGFATDEVRWRRGIDGLVIQQIKVGRPIPDRAR